MQQLIHAGDLDRLITFRERSESKDLSTGRITLTWPDRGEPVWAARRDVTGSEQLRAGQLAPQCLVRWIVRRRDDLALTDRILGDDGLLYEIQAIAEREGRECLEVSSKQIVAP